MDNRRYVIILHLEDGTKWFSGKEWKDRTKYPEYNFSITEANDRTSVIKGNAIHHFNTPSYPDWLKNLKRIGINKVAFEVRTQINEFQIR